jgi:hypothetical protein
MNRVRGCVLPMVTGGTPLRQAVPVYITTGPMQGTLGPIEGLEKSHFRTSLSHVLIDGAIPPNFAMAGKKGNRHRLAANVHDAFRNIGMPRAYPAPMLIGDGFKLKHLGNTVETDSHSDARMPTQPGNRGNFASVDFIPLLDFGDNISESRRQSIRPLTVVLFIE